ncbi:MULTISPECIES: hypothetical protein [unclassified Exiguobacterium]|uniref:hypothetical protein n=2 Tax=unclassified Exiguobacterium TaxID=2644629 RepID=UPI001BE76606|nr:MULTISPECIES: hypothetical protein [unclassified Exiguobacterium]
MTMNQTFTEAQALILEMGEKFKPYIVVGLKQRLEMEEIISTFETYLQTRKFDRSGHRIISKFSFEQFILQMKYS